MDFPELNRIKKLYGLPEFIKESEVNHNPKGLTRQEYADTANKKYPCDSPTNTYLSNALFWENSLMDKSASVVVGENLLDMARYWGIEKDVKDNILSKVVMEKAAEKLEDLDEDSFALCKQAEDGTQVKRYPTINEEFLKQSATKFYQERYELPFEWRRDAAKKLYKKAEEYNTDFENDDIADYIERAAGKGISSSQSLAAQMKKRAVFVDLYAKEKEAATKLKETAKAIESQPSSRELCEKVANILNKTDEEFKLYQFYGDKMDLPEEVCHGVLLKHATIELDKYIKLSTGTTYKKEDLVKCSSDISYRVPEIKEGAKNVIGALDKEAFYKEIKKLDREQAEKVEEMLDLNGVLPATIKFDLSLFD